MRGGTSLQPSLFDLFAFDLIIFDLVTLDLVTFEKQVSLCFDLMKNCTERYEIIFQA